MQAAFYFARDLYCTWILASFLQNSAQFPFILVALSLFVFSTGALLQRNLKLTSFSLRFLAVSFALWITGASLRRPLPLLALSLLASSLLKEEPLEFFSVPLHPQRHLHALCCIVGAIGGAAFVPLDWAVEWQKFPIPVSIGLCIGSAIGRLIELLG